MPKAMCGGRGKTRTEREEGRKGKGDLCSPPDRMVREAKSRSCLVGITVCPPACPSLPEASPASLRRSLPRSSARRRRRSVSFLLRKGNTRWIGEILIMRPAIHPSIHSSGRARPSVGFVTDMAPPPTALRAGMEQETELLLPHMLSTFSEVFLQQFICPSPHGILLLWRMAWYAARD